MGRNGPYTNMTDKTDFEMLEEAGHVLTLVSGPLAGITTYYCERCGALCQSRSSSGVFQIIHIPPGHPSKTSACVELPRPPGNGKPRTLKQKLDDERDFDNDRLKAREP
jgi:hypothetical protein